MKIASKELKANLNELNTGDIYSLMLFMLYKTQEIPEYAVLSELCFLLDGSNLTRLLNYFAGKTVKFPTKAEMIILTNALLLYQFLQVDGNDITTAISRLPKCTQGQQDKSTELYFRLMEHLSDYNFDRKKVVD